MNDRKTSTTGFRRPCLTTIADYHSTVKPFVVRM